MIKKTTKLIVAMMSTLLLTNCNTNQENISGSKQQKRKPIIRKQPQKFTYSLVKTSEWLKNNKEVLNTEKTNILLAVNRTDKSSLAKIDSILIPSNFDGDVVFYLPFPIMVRDLNDINKILLFSYPTQTFGAYENGELIYSGSTSMGSKLHPTPVGLYFCNWKAEQTTSTFNDEWDLKWNFNIENKEGIGFHQYELPGIPASHSCLRLTEKDAKFLYNWADQWEIKGTDNILANGTPVIVFGTYEFMKVKPWKQLTEDPGQLNLTPKMISKIVGPFYENILIVQQKREAYFSTSSNN